MFCQNCGVEVTSGSVFCQNCGIKTETGTGAISNSANSNPQPLMPPPPVYNLRPVISQPVTYAAAIPVNKPKRRHLGLWIFLSVLLISVAGVMYLVASALWLGPKDLGIRYTQKDFNKVMQELDIHISADLGNGNSYDNTDILNGSETATGYFSANNDKAVKVSKLNYEDFNWEFSNYEKKSIKVSDVQATAVMNEIAPAFIWLTDTQVKIEPDGSVKFSSALNVETFIRDLFQSIEDKIQKVEDKIKIKLPKKLNLYLEGPGKFAIINNKVSKIPKKVTSSLLTVPEKYLTDDNANAFVSYFTDLFIKIDFNIEVDKFYIENGEFFFTGTIPTEVKVTPKNAE